MTVPTYQGVAGLHRAAQDTIEAECGTYLTAAAAGLSLTLPYFATVYRGELEPPNMQTPSCGVYVQSTGLNNPTASDTYDQTHTLMLVVTLVGGGPGAPDVEAFSDTLHAYARAANYTLSRHLAEAAYGGAVGVLRCDTVDSAALEPEPLETGQFRQQVITTLNVIQRVARWGA